ncbi:magnesium/cobalt transporter CorA [Halothiobacillus sp. DCM-1]|uniref:magnesium/cobalt transporter CorA n=1 Tax=Halothiobacillus sp. DCM-1 TaxID=3112558 RepID=UPI0032507C12
MPTAMLDRLGRTPGILLDDLTPTTIHLRLCAGTGGTLSEQPNPTLEAAALLANQTDLRSWLHVQGRPSRVFLEELGQRFGLHPLLLEDIQSRDQRPKIDEYPDHLFVILPVPRWVDGELHQSELHLILGKNQVISLHDAEEDITPPLLARFAHASPRLQQYGAEYVFYALMDLVIDQLYPLLARFGETVDALEEQLVTHPGQNALAEIQTAKRALNTLRRQLWPTREVVSHLLRGAANDPLLSVDLKPFLNDLYDHTVAVMDLLESYRDTVSGLIDIHLSSVSNRLNEIMRTLTVISTVFIPLTFITGIYGMNFGNNTESPFAMPELKLYYGYPIVLTVMAGIALAMISWFHRKGWIFNRRKSAVKKRKPGGQ